MADFDDRDSFSKWLKDRSAAFSIALAARSAMRAAPALAQLANLNQTDDRAAIVLPVFRALSAACFVGTWPSFVGAWPNEAAKLTRKIANVDAEMPSDLVARAAYRAVDTAASFAVAAYKAAGATHSSDLAEDVRSTIDAAYSTASLVPDVAISQGVCEAAEVWQALRDDANFMEYNSRLNDSRGEVIAAMWREPLWRMTGPRRVEAGWQYLKSALLSGDAQGEHWHVWTDWYEARLHPDGPFNAELEKARILEITDEDWDQGPAHVNAKIAEIEARFATPPKQSPHGATWALEGSRLTITSISPEIGERAEVLQPLAIEALRELTGEIGPSQQFGTLREKAERAIRIAEQPLATVNEESAALWALSVWFGNYAERDDAVKANAASFAEALEADQRLALETAIRQLAAFTRQFRTARELDQEDAEFRRAAFRIGPHREVIDAAYRAELIDDGDRETVVEMVEAADGPAVQADKAGAGTIWTVRNLLVASVVAILTPVGMVGSEALKVIGQEAGKGVDDVLSVRTKVRRMTEDAAEAVDEIIDSAPPDLRRGLDPLRAPIPPRKP